MAKIQILSYISKCYGAFWGQKGLKTFRFFCELKTITYWYLAACRFVYFDFRLLRLECNKIPPTFAAENQNKGVISYLRNDEKIFS